MKILFHFEFIPTLTPPHHKRYSLAALLFTCCVFFQATASISAEDNRRVLVFYEQGRSSPGVALIDREIRAVLEKQTIYHIDLYVEYMETNLFTDPVSQQKIREWYLQKYRDHQPDVIIAAGRTPIHFMIEEHQKSFPGVPVIVCGTTENWKNRPELDSMFTGTWLEVDSAKTLDVALKLQPDTRQVLVVNGIGALDKALEDSFRRALRVYEDRLSFTYLSGLPMSTLLPKLKHAPDHTIILYGAISQDTTGKRFIPATQSLPVTVGAANAPIFVLGDVLVGQGSVGGYVSSYATQGRLAAIDAMRIFGGEKPQNIPIVSSINTYLFDWRALKRWGLQERNLPAGSIVLNRQPTLMEEYGRYVFVGLLLLFAQLVLILELLRQRAKERLIKRHLRESEALLREAQSIAQCGSWVWSFSENKTYWSDEMYCIMGLVPQSVTPTHSLIYQGSEQCYIAKMMQAANTRQPYLAEHRIVRPDGQERIVLETGHPKYDSLQRPVSMVGTLLDITDQRRAERVLRESEERFRSMADGAPVMMWMSEVDKLRTDFNRGWLMFTGHSIEEELGIGWIEGVHLDDLQKCKSTYIEAFNKRMPFSMEYRLRRYDGEDRWINDAGSPRFLPDGQFVGYIGCAIDVHDHKAVELARMELARRLMIAQEEERSRVARELHDGIGQEIALLSIQMQRAVGSITTEPSQIYPTIQNLSTTLAAIGLHVSRLSHQLHSSELEYLGTSVAITKLCREFSEQYAIKVECCCTNIPANLDNQVALGFLRIVQEALHNIAKHSHAKDVQVKVTGATKELCLVIRDNGVGFDIREPRAEAGLGLISMRERMHLIGGEFAIESSPGVGTIVRARVQIPTTQPPVASPEIVYSADDNASE